MHALYSPACIVMGYTSILVLSYHPSGSDPEKISIIVTKERFGVLNPWRSSPYKNMPVYASATKITTCLNHNCVAQAFVFAYARTHVQRAARNGGYHAMRS